MRKVLRGALRSANGMASAGPRPIVVSGPSGGGKSTLLKRLFKDYPNAFAFSVSHTTRNPRPGEHDGKDYHFIQRSAMHSMINNGDFLEHAEFGGNMYGTSRKAVADIQATGRICILDLELQGVRSVKATDLNSKFVFVRPPNIQELEKRLRDRKTETEESLKKRLDRAKTDMQIVQNESGLFDEDVVNDDLDTAYRDFVKAIEDELKPFINESRL